MLFNLIEYLTNKTWLLPLEDEFQKEYFLRLQDFVEKEYEEKNIYPPEEEIFSAFNMTDFDKVKVLILGQDPYHGKGQGHGLAFSVKDGVKLPPSLRNIYKELESEYSIAMNTNGNLTSWAEQGVLLMNTVLTVEEAKANSHKNKGWEVFTDEVIRILSQREDPMVFILWGKPAEKKRELIDEGKHLVLTSPHPSPLSARRGFFGNNHFVEANSFLADKGIECIDWVKGKVEEELKLF